MGSWSPLSLLLVAALPLGCSAAVVEEGDDLDGHALEAPAATPPSTKGTVTVEQVSTLAPMDGEGSVRTRVSARFVRVSGRIDHASAERIIGSTSSLSEGGPLAAGWPDAGERARLDKTGGCRWLEAAARATAGQGSTRGAAREGSIELLDVGEIVVQAGSHILPLAQRAFPDVGGVVSGVVYTSRDDSTLPGGKGLPVGATYYFETSGSDLVDGFSAKVLAPDAPREVRVAGQRIEPGMSLPLAGWPLSWQPQASADTVYVTIAAVGGTLECDFADAGAGIIPASFVGELAGEVELSVHRVRYSSIRPFGVSQGGVVAGAVVQFDFSVAVRATVGRATVGGASPTGVGPDGGVE